MKRADNWLVSIILGPMLRFVLLTAPTPSVFSASLAIARGSSMERAMWARASQAG